MKTIELARPRITLLSRTLWVVFFALLTGLTAWVRIPLPFTPVPITLQTAVVLACGIWLGRDGLYSQVLYLLLGGVGLPLFALQMASPALFGPTGGYLVGFVLAAAFVGRYAQPRWSDLGYFRRTALLSVSLLCVFIPGVVQLSLWMDIPIRQAAILGFWPFVLGDLVKVLLVAGIPARPWR